VSSPASAARSGDLDAILAQASTDRERLNGGAIGPVSLTALGVAAVVGAGIFVTTGVAASQYAGPAVVISFLIAGFAAAATSVCYAEMAAMIPAAGSTYSYAFATFGSFLAWIIGWDLLLEYLFGASTVAVGWSGYFVSLLGSIGITVPHDLAAAPFGEDAGIVNLPAALVVLAMCGLLGFGMRESARANNALVALKLTVLVAFILIGAWFIKDANWSPFVPANEGAFGEFGWSGVLRAAGVVFFAYIGFDAVSTAAAETRDPKRTVPLGLLATVAISTGLYVAIATVMTGMASYRDLNVADPLSAAIRAAGPSLDWFESILSLSAVVGLAATVMVVFYGQTRILMRMASDGLLPAWLGRVSGTHRTPVGATAACAVGGALVAGLVPIDALTNLVSIGTLFAFVIVSSAVVVLRRRRPDLERPFRVPALPLVAGIAITSSLALIAMLPAATWVRLVVWLLIGLAIYLSWGRRNSRARMSSLGG
jgi:APA family basic amino acid/polyamine antiporter